MLCWELLDRLVLYLVYLLRANGYSSMLDRHIGGRWYSLSLSAGL
jgi:hypothetical protein